MSENPARAEGAMNGERMESAFCFRAKSEGGQNEIEIVLSFSAGFVPKERRKSRISWRFSLVARNPARFESKIHVSCFQAEPLSANSIQKSLITAKIYLPAFGGKCVRRKGARLERAEGARVNPCSRKKFVQRL